MDPTHPVAALAAAQLFRTGLIDFAEIGEASDILSGVFRRHVESLSGSVESESAEQKPVTRKRADEKEPSPALERPQGEASRSGCAWSIEQSRLDIARSALERLSTLGGGTSEGNAIAKHALRGIELDNDCRWLDGDEA